jgi:P27 family predicted phage terminase small subunit
MGGRRGPPPKPTKLKLAAGNPGKRKLNEREPQPAGKAPAQPAWLSDRAKVEWKRIVPELLTLGLLSRIDLAALAAYCQALAELEIATRTIETEGRICRMPIFAEDDVSELVPNPATGDLQLKPKILKGQQIGERLKTHPAVTQQREAMRLVKQFLAEFGLSPSSRSRVAGDSGPAPAADPRGAKFFA